jgi:hypothetical protein
MLTGSGQMTPSFGILLDTAINHCIKWLLVFSKTARTLTGRRNRLVSVEASLSNEMIAMESLFFSGLTILTSSVVVHAGFRRITFYLELHMPNIEIG